MPSLLRGKGLEAVRDAMDAASRDDYRQGQLANTRSRDETNAAFKAAEFQRKVEMDANLAAQRSGAVFRQVEASERDWRIKEKAAILKANTEAQKKIDAEESLDHALGFQQGFRVLKNGPGFRAGVAELERQFPKHFKATQDFEFNRAAQFGWDAQKAWEKASAERLVPIDAQLANLAKPGQKPDPQFKTVEEERANLLRQKAELSGETPVAAVAQPAAAAAPTTSAFKEGEIKERNGATYKRDAQGVWHLQP